MDAERALLLGFVVCSLPFLAVNRAEGQAAAARSAAPPAVSIETYAPPVDTPPEGLIHLDVAATDRAGQFVPGLSEQDFTLLDNGAPQKIVSFRASDPGAADGSPVDNERLTEVVLVLDEVNLSTAQYYVAKTETIEFLRENGGHLARPVSLCWFTTTGLYASAKPTTDGNALAEQVAHRRPSRVLWENPPKVNLGFTIEQRRHALWDKALKAVYSIAVARRDTPGRKVLVWTGFGWPAGSGLGEDASLRGAKDVTFSGLVELSTRLREARVAVCEATAWPDPQNLNSDYPYLAAGVRTASDLQDPVPHLALAVLATQSGGLVLDLSVNVARDIGRCVEDASRFYSLSYNPPHAAEPDEYHDLKVEIRNPGLAARTNTGYYDQPVFYNQPRAPSRKVTVHELEQMLHTNGGEHDSELAEQLNDLELTERLSSSQLTTWKQRLHGSKSKAALVALADESVFLAPPSEAIPADATPDHEAQVKMISQTAQYLEDALRQLPDFYATRSTIQYEQRSQREQDTWKTAVADQSLRDDATEKATLRYRNGQEESSVEKRTGSHGARAKTLYFKGIFGPILASVFADAMRAESRLTWNRWERGQQGIEAVFQYHVGGKSPTYAVVDCCLRGGRLFRVSPQYYGEIAIDPATGAILRLTMESKPGWVLEPNLHPVLPVITSGMMVEYGPVEIGGRSYICPQRSVVIIRTRSVRPLTFWDQSFEVYTSYETQLDDMTYTEYHKFGSDSNVLPGFEVVPDAASKGGGGSQPKTPPSR